MRDLLFAWRVAKFVKSNAIVYCGAGRTLGIGAGQMSRVDSTRIAAAKAQAAEAVARGLGRRLRCVLSVSRRPRRRRRQRRRAVIQPGGSVRDDEVIAAADERGIAMVFTGVRHFRH